jgi:hypothetical protein
MYDAVGIKLKELMVVRVLMTVCVMEFFGPWIKDYSPSHLFNPDWVGHARVHMMWLLGFFLFSGLANLYLIWFARPLRLANLYISFMWLGANFLGFWLSVVMVPHYDGLLVVPRHHVMIMGIEENVFAFTVLGVIYLSALALLHLRVRPKVLAANA